MTVEISRLEEEIRSRPMPGHVAVVMDGNGRWAELRGQARVLGHREGSQSVREVTRVARRLGIRALTLYAFSTQNWARPSAEVSALMGLLGEFLESEREELLDNEIRLHAVGDLSRLPEAVRKPLDAVREETREEKGMTLTLALSYGGREEILQAVRALCEEARMGVLSPGALDEATFESRLWTSELPPLDLLIRTSGELRLSNFLLWQSAYAELVFTDTLWPDFREQQFLECLATYQKRERRFGLTSTQLRPTGA